MTYEDLIVLIPSHSLEDFPAELGEPEAASLLNSFAVAWHPALLASARMLPRWHRADDPPDSTQKRLVFLPTHCESWVPAGWADRVASEGSIVVRGVSDRAEMIAQAVAPLGLPECDPELAADFMALGFCYIQIELLTRKMRHFSNLDEVHLQREAVAAAEAALASDFETARTRLKACFDVLAESRERFYPVDCYLIDLCLVIPRLADENFRQALRSLKPMSVLASARDLETLCDAGPDLQATLKEAVARGTTDIVCGDLCELPLPLMSVNSVVWQLQESQELVERLLGKRPVVWGRRRYGVLPQLPQLLRKAGLEGALHTVLDDGIYPDAEHSKLRWEGTDGTSIDAWSRIPLAGDASTSFLRFPDRMSESMDNDHVAAVMFARWPDVKSPFFEDLRRMAEYAPVLGRFITLSDFFKNTDHPTRHARYKPAEYLTPYLFQAVAREESDPLSRYASRFSRAQRLDVGLWLSGVNALLEGRSPDRATLATIERQLARAGDPPTPEAAAEIDQQLERLVQQSAGRLADIVLKGAGDRAGYLVFNPLPFRRLVSVPLDPAGPRPAPDTDRTWLQWDPERAWLTVDVAGSGFAWVPIGPGREAEPPSSTPSLAEPNLLRNEFFEVHVNEATGGIARIKGYGRSPNRLSQQLNYRFSRERTVTTGTGDRAEEATTHYAEMRMTGSRISCSGPALGEIVTTGEIIDQSNGQRLAGFTQTMRVWRGRPVVEIDAELIVDRMPDAEPWHNYFAARFAWHDETASVTRAVLLGAHEVTDERFESAHYIELASGDQRTTIIPEGLPFHRKTGPRMIDTILVVPRETRRRFRFTIAIDQNYPLQAAFDALVPAVVTRTEIGPPRAGAAGWFFHLSTRSVQLLALLPLEAEPVASTAPTWEPVEPTAPLGGCGCGLRLMETEGRPVRARLRCFRAPTRARQRDFTGRTVHELTVDGDAVLVDLSAHEIAEIELRFD
jgi:alpha-mannosidase